MSREQPGLAAWYARQLGRRFLAEHGTGLRVACLALAAGLAVFAAVYAAGIVSGEMPG